jgi:hypothetical protein
MSVADLESYLGGTTFGADFMRPTPLARDSTQFGGELTQWVGWTMIELQYHPCKRGRGLFLSFSMMYAASARTGETIVCGVLNLRTSELQDPSPGSSSTINIHKSIIQPILFFPLPFRGLHQEHIFGVSPTAATISQAYYKRGNLS